MRVFVAGGTGAIGRPLITALVAAGHEVSVLARSAQSAGAARAAGAEPVMGDALDRDSLRAAVDESRPEVVVNQLTSLARTARAKDLRQGIERTGHLRQVVAAQLVEAAEQAGARRVVAQSISFIYRPGPGVRGEDDLLYLDAPDQLAATVRSVAALEQATTTAGIEGVVLRYGSFYGPGTYFAPDGAFANLVRRRRLPMPGPGAGVFGFVHVADAVTATLAALDGPAGTYNVVDDVPAPTAEWLPHLAGLLGAKPPRRLPASVVRLVAGASVAYLLCDQPAVSPALAHDRLGWRPAIPDWHDGFAAAFRS